MKPILSYYEASIVGGIKKYYLVILDRNRDIIVHIKEILKYLKIDVNRFIEILKQQNIEIEYFNFESIDEEWFSFKSVDDVQRVIDELDHYMLINVMNYN